MRRGTSLPELLIGLLLFGLITALAVPAFRQQSARAREDRLRVELAVVRAALREFVHDNLHYPNTLSVLAAQTAPTAAQVTAPNGSAGTLYDPRWWGGPYIERIPLDPVSGSAFIYSPGSSGGVRSSASGSDSRGVLYLSY